MIFAFIVGYVCIAMEHKLQVNKAASALMTAGVLWVLYILTIPLAVPLPGTESGGEKSAVGSAMY